MIERYQYEKTTNIKEHNDIVNKLNEVIGAVNSGTTYDAYTKEETDALLADKEDKLISGTTIKTINNISLLGSGNIDVSGGGGESYTAGDGISITDNAVSVRIAPKRGLAFIQNGYLGVTINQATLEFDDYGAITIKGSVLANKQDTLISGSNIKTINNTSILGSGNIDISGGGKTAITNLNQLTVNDIAIGYAYVTSENQFYAVSGIVTLDGNSVTIKGLIISADGTCTTEKTFTATDIDYTNFSMYKI